MRTSASLSLSLVAASTLFSVSTRVSAAPRAAEAPALRHAFNVVGGYTIVGNTLAQDCRASVAKPLPPSTVGACGNNTDDTGADVFWAISTGNPAVNEASVSVLPGDASSRVVLTLPAQATVRHARLYWAASVNRNTPEAALAAAQLDRGAASVPVVAERTWNVGRDNDLDWYQSTADVTKTVTSWGAGVYDFSGLAVRNFRNENNGATFAAFSLVVVYDEPSAAAVLQNVTLFDGFDVVENGTTKDTLLTGFAAPTPGTSATLGVIGYEGDEDSATDTLSFAGTPLGNATNPQKNFFNSSRTLLGAVVGNAGDAPLLTGAPDSMSGLDLDIVDVGSLLPPGSTSVKIEPRSTGESLAIGAYVLGVAVPGPKLDTVKKVDRSPARYLAGDPVQYEIAITNNGVGPAFAPDLRDVLSDKLAYDGKLSLYRSLLGTTAQLTDQAGDDVGTYDAPSKTIIVKDDAGKIMPGETWIIRFQAKVLAGTTGAIDNQAIVLAKPVDPTGDLTVSADSHPPGAVGPTTILVDGCNKNEDCATGKCDVDATPRVCVGGGSAGAAGSGGEAGSAGSGGEAGSAGNGGTAGSGGAPPVGGQAGIAGQSGQAGFSGVGGAAGTAGKGGTAGAAGKGGTAGTAGKGGTAGAAGQTSAGTGGSSGKAGTAGAAGNPATGGSSGKAGTGGGSGAPALADDDRFQGSGISCAVEARPNTAGRFGGWAALGLLAIAWLRRRARAE